MRAGRSVKQTVTEFTPRKTSFPSLKLTFFAFCTNRTSTFFSDCLPVAVQVMTGLALGAGVGDAAWTLNGLGMMMPATAPHIRMCLFILIGFRINLGFIGSSVGSRQRVNLSVSGFLSCLRQNLQSVLLLRPWSGGSHLRLNSKPVD